MKKDHLTDLVDDESCVENAFGERIIIVIFVVVRRGGRSCDEVEQVERNGRCCDFDDEGVIAGCLCKLVEGGMKAQVVEGAEYLD